MEIRQLEYIPNLSVALGFFDGVHLGHQKVISSAVEYAKNNNLKSAVITFKEHPFCVLKNIKPQYILSRQDSYKIMEQLGADYIFELDFNQLKNMSAEEYLSNVLVKYFKPSAIFTGYNHNFGTNRQGNSDFLRKYQGKYSYKYFEISAQSINGKLISSSAIRMALKSGQIELANSMLGNMFNISGTVVEGQKLGRTIGFPTININYPKNIVELLYGVYGVKVKVENQVYDGIANFGTKPTVSENLKPILEVHLLNFDNDIYGHFVQIGFIKVIRPEKKFSSLTDLRNQIIVDISGLR